MSRKHKRLAAVVESFQGRGLDPHYLGYFNCFNRQLFYEAHEVLERLWLKDKHGPNGAFYKGLIQLAGAFVHLQKHRPQPALALFKLARTHLEGYSACHEHLNVQSTRALIAHWLARLDRAEVDAQAFGPAPVPTLELSADADVPQPVERR